MPFLRNIASGIRSLFQRKRAERELDEELRGFMEMAAEERMKQGGSQKDALHAVRLERGSLEAAKELVRSAGWESLLETSWRDLRYGIRVLRASPGFATIALLTLTLGLGINCAIFTVVDAVLLRPLPYPNSERLVLVDRHFPEGTFPATSATKFLFWQEHSRSFESIAAYAFASSGVNLTGTGEPEPLRSLRVSADFFRTLGVRLVLGRGFTPEEDRLGGPNAVVLSNELWQRFFGRDRGIVGRVITLGGQLWTVVGVAPPGFSFTPAADVWMPLRAQINPHDQTNVFSVLGRLHAGVSYAQADQDVRALGEQFRRRYPDLMGPHETVTTQSYQNVIVGDARPDLLLVLGAAGFVLLIACANLANLLLSRSTSRHKEMAVRLALGATRLRLTRQLFIESGLLAVAGGGLGLAAAWGLLPLVLRLAPQNLPRLHEVHMNWQTWIFAFAAALVTGIVFGLVPALRGPKADLRDALHESMGRASASHGVARLQRLLIIGEVAVSAVLLIGAGLLIRTFWQLQQVSPGFVSHNVLTAQMTLDAQRYSKTEAVARLENKALVRLESLPGVKAAAAVSNLPSEFGIEMNFAIEENPSGGDPSGSTQWRAITPHYLEVMRIPVLRGRGLKDRDNESGAPVVLINQALAERFFRGQDPLGQHIIIGAGAEAIGLADRPREIVGIVGNTKELGLAHAAPPTFFVPAPQVQDGLTALVNRMIPLVWVVRTSGDPRLSTRAIQQCLVSVATQEAPYDFRTMDEVLSASIAQQRFNMLLLGFFAALAVALGGVGLYGVLSYLVAQRTHEIGIRIALGASRREVMHLVLTNGLRMTLVGLGLGIIAAVGLSHLLAGMLFGVRPTDPQTFVTVSIVLTTVALLASYIPARYATKVDPMVALRHE
jgi:putative ABC transport system permease protein